MNYYNSTTSKCEPHNLTCCDICNCLNLQSSNETVIISKEDCKFDLTIDATGIDKLLTLNNGNCISFIKEYVNNKLVITPVLDWNCIASHVCSLCQSTPVNCNPPTLLSVINLK